MSIKNTYRMSEYIGVTMEVCHGTKYANIKWVSLKYTIWIGNIYTHAYILGDTHVELRYLCHIGIYPRGSGFWLDTVDLSTQWRAFNLSETTPLMNLAHTTWTLAYIFPDLMLDDLLNQATSDLCPSNINTHISSPMINNTNDSTIKHFCNKNVWTKQADCRPHGTRLTWHCSIIKQRRATSYRLITAHYFSINFLCHPPIQGF